MAATDARPIPSKNVAYRVTFPIFDADGDLVTGATGLDSEVSKDGGTFADCTNEATEIATSSGMYYLDLTATEMNADTVAIIVKTTSTGAKTTPIILYPKEAGDLSVVLEDASLTAAKFGASAITSTVLADNAITAAKIASNAITSAKIASGAITATQIAANAIGATQIAADAITAAKIAADAIGSSEFAQAAADKVWATAARALTDKAGFSLTADQSGVTIGTVNTCVSNSDMRGTDNALLAASAPANFGDLAITATTGLVSVGTNNDKTGYSLSADQSGVTIGTVNTCVSNSDMRGTDNALLAASAPANFGDLAITATTGLVSVGTNNDKTGYDLNADQSGVTVGTVNTCVSNSDMRGTDNALLAASAPANFGDLAITATTGMVTVGTNNDKTGYDLNADQSGVTIGTVTTVTTVTNEVTADMVKISGDAGAADNLEAAFDGTGGVQLKLSQLYVDNPSGNAIHAISSGSNGHGLYTEGYGNGHGNYNVGGENGHGQYNKGGGSQGHGQYNFAPNAGHGQYNYGTGINYNGQRNYGYDDHGVYCYAGGIGKHGAYYKAGDGDGLRVEGGSNGNGLRAIKAGSGYDIYADIHGTIDTCTANTDMRGTDNALLAASAPANFGDLAITATTGLVSVGTNNDKTGYDLNADQSGVTIGTVNTCVSNSDMRGTDNALLAASAPANFGDLAITATTGLVSVGTNNDKTGYSISGTKQTLDALNDVSTVEVNAEVDTALSDINLDHFMAAAVTGTDVVDNSALAKLASKSATADWDSYNNTSDSLESISDSMSGSGLTQQQVRDAMKLAPSGGAPASGSVDNELDGIKAQTDQLAFTAGNVNADIQEYNTHPDVDLNADQSGVTIGTVNTCTTNTDMRGTDNALLAASAPANFGDLAITATTGMVTVGTNNDKTGYDLNADQSGVTIGTVNTCVSNSDMRGTDNALLAASAPANFSDLAITATTGLVSVGTNNDKTGYDLNADQSGVTIGTVNTVVAVSGEVDIGSVKGVGVAGVNDFKADVSGLATEANATTNKAAIITEVDANETKIDTMQGDVTKLRYIMENPWKYDFTGTPSIAKLRNAGDSADIATQPVYKEDGSSKPATSAEIATRGVMAWV